MANDPKVKPLKEELSSKQGADGFTKSVAAGVEKTVRGAYELSGKQVRVKGTRFIPSTVVELGRGRFQVMANTVVEIAGQGGRPSRSEAVESVVTVGRKKAGQVLDGVKIPAFERLALR